MSRATPQIRDLAAMLIACETNGEKSFEPKIPDGFQVCEKLRPHLATLMGKAGFQAVLSRAIAVSSGEAPWLGAMRVTADGSLEGWDNPEDRLRTPKLASK